MHFPTEREYYERGYWDGVTLSYIPDFPSEKLKNAWVEGFRDAKANVEMSETKYLPEENDAKAK